MQLTYYGHACFQVELAGKKLLFDPFITPNEQAKNVDIHSIEADYILLSHGHADHVADAVFLAKKTGATVIGSWEVINWINNQGVQNNHPMNIGGSFIFPFGTVKCVVAQHSSALPDGSYGGNPMGFIVSSRQGNFYYSGDTALTMDMQLIPKWVKLDFAVLPIGDNFTMGYQDAAMAAEIVESKKVVGVHYNTFEWIKIDTEAAYKAFTDKKIELLLPSIGETISLK